MLKCIVVSGPAKFEALAFKDDLYTSIKKVAALGYDTVELAIRDPNLVDAQSIKELVEQLNLPVVAIGTGQAYGEEGLSFTDLDPSIRAKAIQRIKDQVQFAAKFGAKVIIGLIRGKVQPGVEVKQAEEWLVSALQECADYAQPFGVTLVVEPINRYETNLINTVAETIEIIKRTSRTNLQVLFDTFHANIEESSILDSIREVAPYLGHFHVADSNRWAPGCGHLDFPSILDVLKEVGYSGAVSAEILPKPDPDSSARLTIEYMKRLGL
ncbi:5-keto-L-gluconate epimerase [Desulfotomaculum nigrificans]|uniref:5-keto-L-gluconate epimerase n=1 Tax=Desulfotomaculum nigrificans TaxID=1565 RepID=UPI0001FAEC9C|nr:5-keto-L-gluconate epimerase [Desulfotomaculum nigrificans]